MAIIYIITAIFFLLVVGVFGGRWWGRRSAVNKIQFMETQLTALNELSEKTSEKLKEQTLALAVAQQQLVEAKEGVQILEEVVDKQEGQLKKITTQKKSSEVRTGRIAENSLGFISELPYDFMWLRFLGSPVDYIYFDFSDNDDPKVGVIEVKSGNAKETKHQRLVKKAIQNHSVYYELVRLGVNGVTVKRG